MFRDLLEKTEEYLKTEGIIYSGELDLSLQMQNYPGLTDYLFGYLESKYRVSIPEQMKKGCRSLMDIYEVTGTDIFRSAACMETYALLNSLNMRYRMFIPKAFIDYLADWVEQGEYRWDVSEYEKRKISQKKLEELDLSEMRVLPGTEFFVQDAVDSYYSREPDAKAAKEFPPETKEEIKGRMKAPDWLKRWPFADELPLCYRYPAEQIRNAKTKKQPLWEVRIRKHYERYLVLKHRNDRESFYADAFFVQPFSTVVYDHGREKIEFFDYICNEAGEPMGIHCLITGGDGTEEKEFRIEELYLNKTEEVNSTTDTLIQHSYNRKYVLTD